MATACANDSENDTYVPTTGQIAVLNVCAQTVQFYSTASYALLGQVAVQAPVGLVFDPDTGLLYTYDSNDLVLFAIDPTTYQVANTFFVDLACITDLAQADGTTPDGTLILSQGCGDGDLYFIDATTGEQLGPNDYYETGLDCPNLPVTYDPLDGDLYVGTCIPGGAIEVVSVADQTSNEPPMETQGGCPGAGTYDDGTGTVYLEDSCDGYLYQMSYGEIDYFWSDVTPPNAGSPTYSELDNEVFIPAAGGVVSVFNTATFADSWATAGTCPTSAAADDGSTGDVFLTDSCTPQITVIDSSGGPVTTITGTSGVCDTYSSALDTSNGLLYAVNGCAKGLTILNPSTGATLGEFAVGLCPDQIVYDPTIQILFLSDSCQNLVWAVDPATETMHAIELGSGTDFSLGLALDLTNGTLYVVGECPIDYCDGGTLYVISAGSESVLYTSDEFGCYPNNVAVDPLTGQAFVTDVYYDCSEVYKLSSQGYIYDQELYTGCPEGITYDPQLGSFAVADPCYGEIYNFDPVSMEQTSETDDNLCPTTITYDPNNQLLYVGDNGLSCQSEEDYYEGDLGEVSVVSQTTSYGGDPAGLSPHSLETVLPIQDPGSITFDPTNGELLVPNGGSVQVISTELGLGAPSVAQGAVQAGSPEDTAFSCVVGNGIVLGTNLYEPSYCDDTLVETNLTDPSAPLTSATGPSDVDWLWAIAYDPVNGLIYGTVGYDNEVLYFSPQGPTYLGEVSGVQGCATGVTVDGAGDVWVADPCEDNVEEIDPSTESTVAQSAALSQPDYAVTYDPQSGTIIAVTASGSSDVNSEYALFPVSDPEASPTTVPLPVFDDCVGEVSYVNLFGGLLLTMDSGSGWVLSCSEDPTPGQIEAIYASNGGLLGTVNEGGCLSTMLVDPISLSLFAADDCIAGVWDTNLLNGDTSMVYSEESEVDCPTGLAEDFTSDTVWSADALCSVDTLTPISFVQNEASQPWVVDVGQQVQVTSTLWGAGASPDLLTVTAGQTNPGVQCGVAVAGPSGSNEVSGICFAMEAGNYTVWLNATDVDGNTVSSWVTIQVVNTLEVAEVQESVFSADSGQYVTFTASVLGGATVTEYAWNSANWLGVLTCPTVSLDSPSITCQVDSLNFQDEIPVYVQVFDTSGTSATSPTNYFLADPDPTIATAAASTQDLNNTTTADVGDSLTFWSVTSSVSAFTMYWAGLPAGCAVSVSAPTCEASVAGTFNVQLYVTDGNGFTTVSYIDQLTVYPALSVSGPTGSQGAADAGQTVTFSASAAGGYGADAFLWTAVGDCATHTTATITCVLTPANVSGSAYSVSVVVEDQDLDSTTSGLLSFLVSADPAASAPVATASATSADVGQVITFSTTASLGSLSYTTYTWSNLPGVCSGTTTATVRCDLTTAVASASITVTVTDSNGRTSSPSTALVFTVYADPTVSTPHVTPTSVDAGQTATLDFTTTAGAGDLTYSTYTWTGLPSGCAGSGASVTCSASHIAAGTYAITVEVEDSNGGLSAESGVLAFTVDPALEAATPVASSSTGDVGGSVTFTSGASGGAGSYSYSWLGLPVSCPLTPSDTVTCSLSSADAGGHSISLQVTDANGETVTSSALAFTVDQDPLASTPVAVPAATSADVGQVIDFSTTASSGDGVYVSFAWLGLPGVCSGTTTDSVSCDLTASGSFTISAEVTDSNGGDSGPSGTLTFTVVPSVIAASLTVSSAVADVGQSVTFTGGASGGTGTYTYTWAGLPPSCTAPAAATLTCTMLPSDVGNYIVALTATDTNGASSTGPSVALVVYADPSTGTPTASVAQADLGQTVTFTTAGASGGSGTYVSYSWTGLPGLCSGTTTATVTCSITATGSFLVAASVEDSSGFASPFSSPVAFTAYGDPSATTPVSSVGSATVGESGSVTFTSSGVGGDAVYSSFAWTGLPSGCTGTTTGSVTCAGTTFTSAGTYLLTARVTDSDGATSAWSAALAFVVDGAPSAGTPTVNRTSVDALQLVKFTDSASGGSGGYTFAWSGLPTGCAQVGATALCTLGAGSAGSYQVTVVATDSNGVASAASSPVGLTVYTDPSASTPVANRTTADLGQWVAFSESASGGSGGYTYAWSGLPATGCLGTTTSTVDCPLATSGTLTVVSTVVDSDGELSTSAPLSFTVAGPVSVTTPTATVPGSTSTTTADVGQAVTIFAQASGGTAPYTYAWTGLTDVACSGLPGASVVCTFSSAEAYTIGVVATDAQGESAASAWKLNLTISAMPGIQPGGISVSPTLLDADGTLTLSATVGGGVAPWSYVWSGLPTGCTSENRASFSCTPTESGVFFVTVVATDAAGAQVSGQGAPLVINPSPTVALSESATNVQTGVAITFLASGSGGTGILTYSWNFGDGTTATGQTASHAYAKAGSYTVTVTVTDAMGQTASASVPVVISNAPAGAPQFLGTGASAGYTLLATLLMVITSLALFVFLYFRKGKGTTPAATTSPASSAEDDSEDETAPTPSTTATPEANDYSEGKP